MARISGTYTSVKLKIALTLILICFCLASIVGATYAIFTNGEDGKIGINATSGKIDIDIVDLSDNSLVGDVLDFDFSGTQMYFEPGATFLTEGFKVKNGGDVNVNFRVNVSNDTMIDAEEFNNAFEFFILTDKSAVDSGTALTEYKGSLLAGESSQTYYLAIRMKKDADNKFQNKLYTGIGITVYAVQGNVDIV